MIRFLKIVFLVCFCFYLGSVVLFYGRISIEEKRFKQGHSELRANNAKFIPHPPHEHIADSSLIGNKSKKRNDLVERIRQLELHAINKPKQEERLSRRSKSGARFNIRHADQNNGRHFYTNHDLARVEQDKMKRKVNPRDRELNQINRIVKLETRSQVFTNRPSSKPQRIPLTRKKLPLQRSQKLSQTMSPTSSSKRSIPPNNQSGYMKTRGGKKAANRKSGQSNHNSAKAKKKVQKGQHPVKLLIDSLSKNVTHLMEQNSAYPKRRFVKDKNKRLPPVQNANFTEIAPDVFLYSAYVDDRNHSKFIRLISIAKTHRDINDKLFCHFRYFSNQKYFHFDLTAASFYRTCEDHERQYSAYVISCPLPEVLTIDHVIQNRIGVFVATSESVSAEMKAVEIINNRIKSSHFKTINVCVPPLFGKVKEDTLIEFIELSEILGANHFTFYLYSVENDVRKLLNMYSGVNEVAALPWRLPIREEDIWYYGQSVSVWDCLFRNMYHFDYISFNDIDEYIVPVQNINLQTMLGIFENTNNVNRKAAGYRFQSAFFDNGNRHFGNHSKEIDNLITMKTVWRTERVSHIRTKLLVEPQKVFELGIHHLSKPMEEQYHAINIQPEVALIHHYRDCEETFGMRCDSFQEDHTTWRFLGNLVQNVRAVKKILLTYDSNKKT